MLRPILALAAEHLSTSGVGALYGMFALASSDTKAQAISSAMLGTVAVLIKLAQRRHGHHMGHRAYGAGM